MKGIPHFASGVAVTSFFPWAIQAAQESNPMYFILGGAFGLLPDTLDFKIYRFFYKHDLYIEPDPLKPDPQSIADQLAASVKAASESKKLVRVKCSTIRMGADAWQQYVIKFDTETDEVLVKFGPVVNTGQVPIPGASKMEGEIGRAKIPCKLFQSYDATTRVDIFDGPTFGFASDGKGGVIMHFLPWHREWTHALTVGLFFGIIGTLIWDWRAGAVITAGYSVHVLEDQLGFMGSNLFWPFTRIRFPGLHWMRSGDAMPNFGTVWLSCLIIFYNLYRAMPSSIYHFNLLHVLFYGAVVPIGLFKLALWFVNRGKVAETGPIELEDEWGDKA